MIRNLWWTVEPTFLKNIHEQFSSKTRPWGYKTIFMLNSTEHAIPIAHKKLKCCKIKIFLAFELSDFVFILLINVKMPTFCWHFNIYEQEKFHVQLCWAREELYNLRARCLSFWQDPSSTAIICVWEQWRSWQDCLLYAQAHLSHPISSRQ